MILGLIIGAVLFVGGFLLATHQMNDAAATHDLTGNVHACVRVYDGRTRIIIPGRPPNCGFGEVLVEWAGPGATGNLETRVEALENQVPDCLSDVAGDAVFSGCNVQVNNGLGTTATTNGLGNLIVGYNANSQTYARTGSHNVVVGDDHGYSAYGGLVVGAANQILGAWSSVTGGSGNTASNVHSSVSGGTMNTASGGNSSVSGGQNNQATNANSSVSGGNGNTASGGNASVTGGQMNTASGTNAAVNGGRDNDALNGNSTVSGGNNNTANNNNSTVSGGQNRTSQSPNDWTGGSLNESN